MILITGATGFLGSEVVRQCVIAGYDVRTTGRTAPDAVDLPNYQAADLVNRDAVGRLVDGVRTIVHCAGAAHRHRVAAEAEFSANPVGTAFLAEAAVGAGVQHFVLASSVAIYGAQSSEPVSESAPARPASPYGTSKLRSEFAAIEAAKGSRMRVTILRFGTLYGENDPGNVLRLIRLIDRGRFIRVGRGRNRKNLLHRNDAARAAILATSRTSNQVATYNVAGPPVEMRQIVDLVANALNRRVASWRLPASPVIAVAAALALTRLPPARQLQRSLRTWLSDEVFDSSRFIAEFGFRPAVSLEEGIRRAVEWYRASGTK